MSKSNSQENIACNFIGLPCGPNYGLLFSEFIISSIKLINNGYNDVCTSISVETDSILSIMIVIIDYFIGNCLTEICHDKQLYDTRRVFFISTRDSSSVVYPSIGNV